MRKMLKNVKEIGLWVSLTAIPCLTVAFGLGWALHAYTHDSSVLMGWIRFLTGATLATIEFALISKAIMK